MKTTFLTALLAGVSTLAFPQNGTNLSRSIDDDGRSLFIRVNGTTDGRVLDFEKKIDVRGLSKKEKIVLTDRILDSLGVDRISYSVDARKEHKNFNYRNNRADQVNVQENEDDRNSDVVIASTQTEPVTEVVSGTKSLRKEMWTDENGFLYIRFKIMRGKDEFIFEKSTEANGLTESGKQKFIKDFEKELELPVM